MAVPGSSEHARSLTGRRVPAVVLVLLLGLGLWPPAISATAPVAGATGIVLETAVDSATGIGTYDTAPRVVLLRTTVYFRIRAPGLSGERVFTYRDDVSATAPGPPWREETLFGDGVTNFETDLGEAGVQYRFFARVLATSGHPELRSNDVTVQWGGRGACPATDEPAHWGPVSSRDGTAYSVILGHDANLDRQWTVVASHVRGVKDKAWGYPLPACLETADLAAGDGTFFLVTVRPEGNGFVEGAGRLWAFSPDRPTPRAIRAFSRGTLIASPHGEVYVRSAEDADTSGLFTANQLARLAPDGRTASGWPYRPHALMSDPAFGADGTVYAAIFGKGSTRDRLVALSVAGRVKSGWPSLLPGRLFATACGDGCTDVPQAPKLAPDGSVFGSFSSGIYMVLATGRSKSGWPYLLPRGTRVQSWGHTDTPSGGPFAAEADKAGRIYLPRADARYAIPHDDLVCLRPNGTFCPGWPVKLPDREVVDDFVVRPAGGVTVTLLNERTGRFHTVVIRLDGRLTS